MDTRVRPCEDSVNDFYITMSSSDSNKYFPRNKPSHFRLKLQERLKLQGSWNVALCEIHSTKRFNQPVYVCSNLTSLYIANGSLSAVLRYIHGGKSNVFDTHYFIRVDGYEYDAIEIYITDTSMNLVSFEDQQVTCTLRFQRT